ncbi:MAG: HoxN/HupN/NixA family nickel/cobalt transporter [Leucobacter sp.]
MDSKIRNGIIAVIALHALAGVALLAAGAHSGAMLGLVGVAYLAGVKHSYDWDHIAAIDNTSRKFAAQGRYEPAVGLAFSLGHSSVVMLACVLVAFGANAVRSAFDEGTTANLVLGVTGASVAAIFLLLMGFFNLGAFGSTLKMARRIRGGYEPTAEDLEPKGLMSRLLSAPLRTVRSPLHLYSVGFLFGLGFDTASTIGLLVVTGSAALAGVPPLSLMAMPLAFTAAMTLCDGANGVAMTRLYARALSEPARRITFNLVVTGLSAASALFVSTLIVAEIARGAWGWSDPVTRSLAGVDLGHAGLMLVAAFLAVWAVAAVRERALQRA